MIDAIRVINYLMLTLFIETTITLLGKVGQPENRIFRNAWMIFQNNSPQFNIWF